MSVSRGLQVEEDDLIQFSEGQPIKETSKPEEQDELNNGDEEEDMVRWVNLLHLKSQTYSSNFFSLIHLFNFWHFV